MNITLPHLSRKPVFRRKALGLVLAAVALGFAGGAFAQATTGTIHGRVPIAPGVTVKITGGAGFNRTIPVSSSGKYSITVPVGTYTVTLQQHGKKIVSHPDVSPVAAGAVTVDFTARKSSDSSTQQ